MQCTCYYSKISVICSSLRILSSGITNQQYQQARRGGELNFICQRCEERNWPAADPEPAQPPQPAPLNASFDIGHRDADDPPEPMET